MEKSKIIIHFVNGEKYVLDGYEGILKQFLDNKEDYLPVMPGVYVMKNNIIYIEVEKNKKDEEK